MEEDPYIGQFLNEINQTYDGELSFEENNE